MVAYAGAGFVLLNCDHHEGWYGGVYASKYHFVLVMTEGLELVRLERQ